LESRGTLEHRITDNYYGGGGGGLMPQMTTDPSQMNSKLVFYLNLLFLFY
jgi:hypothetical protein